VTLPGMKTILIALAALALTPAAAHATTVTYAADGALVVTASPGERNVLDLQEDDSDAGKVVVYEGGTGASISGPCEAMGDAQVCRVNPAAGIRVDLGDGDDWGDISMGLPANLRVSLAGGAGNDKLQGNVQAATLDGGAGNDALQGGDGNETLLGGDGNDTLEGRGGADTLAGGAGDDLLSGDGNQDAAPDVIDGGPGSDRMEDDWEADDSASERPVAVSLAGGADDGRPGEGDDIRNVERIVAHTAGTLVGTDAPEDLEVFQDDRPSTIAGLGGNDVLRGSNCADTIDGGAGDDDIDAGYGDDTITGGPGRDRISGDLRSGGCGPVWCDLPFGNDTIYAQDGEVDSISCGYGQDTVYADAVDVVAGDCEQVIRGAAPAPGAGGGGTPTTPPTPGARHIPAVTSLRFKRHALRIGARDAVKLRVAVKHGPTRTVKVRHGRATVALGRLARGRHRVSVTPLGAHGEKGRVSTLTFVVR
jgi:Ca2+-binding RTX toxin-like protein